MYNVFQTGGDTIMTVASKSVEVTKLKQAVVCHTQKSRSMATNFGMTCNVATKSNLY